MSEWMAPILVCWMVALMAIQFLPVVGSLGLASWGLTYFHSLLFVLGVVLVVLLWALHRSGDAVSSRRIVVTVFGRATVLFLFLVGSFPLTIRVMLDRLERAEVFDLSGAMECTQSGARACRFKPPVEEAVIRGCRRLFNRSGARDEALIGACEQSLSSADVPRIERHLRHFGDGGGPSATAGLILASATLVTVRDRTVHAPARIAIALILVVGQVLAAHIDRAFLEGVLGNGVVFLLLVLLCVAMNVMTLWWPRPLASASTYALTILAALSPGFLQFMLTRWGVTASSAPPLVWLLPFAVTFVVLLILLGLRQSEASLASSSLAVAPGTPKQKLCTLLTQLLITEGDLHRFVAHHWPEIVNELNNSVPLADRILDFAARLIRSDETFEALDRLRQMFPKRERDIEAVRAVFERPG